MKIPNHLKTLVALGAVFIGSTQHVGASMVEHSERQQAAGIDLVTYQSNVKDVVVIVGSFPAGDAMAGGGNIAVPTLTGMMLDHGTKTLDKFAISDQLEDVGATISFGVGSQTVEIHAKCLKKDLSLVVGLIAAQLRTPAFSSAEFAKARQQFIGSLQASTQNTDARSQEAFGRAVFPVGHPNRPHTIEEFLAAAKLASLNDVKAFHAKFYGPAHMTLVLVGDISMGDAQREVTKAFSGWSGGQDYLRPAVPAVAGAAQDVAVPLTDKPSVSVTLGQATGLRYRDPDALALRIGTAVLGRGFTGRLMASVRDKEGLTYNIGAGVAEDSIVDGTWDIGASFAPTLLDKGIASTRRELQSWWANGVSDAELSTRKQGVVGSYLVGLSTTGGLAGAILASIQRGYDVSWLDQYPQAVQALTREQVNAAIHTHLDPSKMVLVEAGSVPQTQAAR